MKITKKTDEELQAMNLIQPGQYPFEVIEATDTVSKAGNEMIALKLVVWDENGREKIVFDYLLDSMFHKVKHFCETAGLEDQYENECLTAADCLGMQGYAHIIIDKSKDPRYADKNAVKDYIKSVTEKKSIKKEEKVEEAFVDDDIPF